MKLSSLVILLGGAAHLSLAYPGMGDTLKALQARRASTVRSRHINTPRQETGDEGSTTEDSNELLGDLKTDGPTTPVGQLIYDLLLGTEGVDPESQESWQGSVPGKDTKECKEDTCCIWKYIADDMEKLFSGRRGTCNDFARAAVRLGFHDAGTWSKATDSLGGGADGSIILAGELSRPENNGLQEIGGVTRQLYDQYKQYGIGMADLIQMGANVATVVCPLGPRVRTFIGRDDSSIPNPSGLLPGVFDSADNLIGLFENKTIRAHGLIALVGAHTTSQQKFVDPSRAGDPQDSTPGIWDILFYGQTLGTVPTPPRVFKFPSDVKLSQHPKTSDEWRAFAGPGGQDHWNEDYAREYIRLSLLGVNKINHLTECTKVLPPVRALIIPQTDEAKYQEWLNGGGSPDASLKIEDGEFLR